MRRQRWSLDEKGKNRRKEQGTAQEQADDERHQEVLSTRRSGVDMQRTAFGK